MAILAKTARFSFAQYVAQNPGTKHTKETYAAGQFKPGELKGEQKTGAVVSEKSGFKWRITLITANWVWAVPAHWPIDYHVVQL